MSERIKCPVCHCEISSDGLVIFRQSKEFSALESLRQTIPELRKRIEALEQISGKLSIDTAHAGTMNAPHR